METVKITIRGGVVEVTERPPGIGVEILDFDNEGRFFLGPDNDHEEHSHETYGYSPKSRFRVIVCEVKYSKIEVGAKDAEEARDMAQDTDADEFTTIGGGSWEISETYEILEEEED